jgi:hypothetical protein
MQFLVVVVVAALWVKYFWLFVAVVASLWLAYRIGRAIREHQDAVAAENARLDDLRARADQQHVWAMQGDPRGMFGEYPPAATDHGNSLPPIRSFRASS